MNNNINMIKKRVKYYKRLLDVNKFKCHDIYSRLSIIKLSISLFLNISLFIHHPYPHFHLHLFISSSKSYHDDDEDNNDKLMMLNKHTC